MKPKTPLQAIRSYCKSCMGGSFEEVDLCPVLDCCLFPYRLGKDPNRSYNLSDEQRALRKEQGHKLAELNKSKKAAQMLRPSEQQK